MVFRLVRLNDFGSEEFAEFGLGVEVCSGDGEEVGESMRVRVRVCVVRGVGARGGVAVDI